MDELGEESDTLTKFFERDSRDIELEMQSVSHLTGQEKELTPSIVILPLVGSTNRSMDLASVL